MHSLLLTMLLLPMADPVSQETELVKAWLKVSQKHAEFQWHYAAASFTDYALSLRLDDKEVWTAERRSIGPLLPHWSDVGSQERLPGD